MFPFCQISIISQKKASTSTTPSPLGLFSFVPLLHILFFSSLFINWTLFIGFQNCFPNSIFKKYKKKGSRLVEAGKAPAKSMGLGWGTGPLWVFTEAFYILQRCWVMWRTHKSTVCLQFAKIISILAVTSHLRLTVQWQFGKKRLSRLQVTVIALLDCAFSSPFFSPQCSESIRAVRQASLYQENYCTLHSFLP